MEARRLVEQFDRCVLAYQVYNQSLLWPLDPWYEQWSRIGSSRRDNMLAAVHDAIAGEPHPSDLRGPGGRRDGWVCDRLLDPVVADYAQVRPWRPCLSFDGLEYRLLAGHVGADIGAASVASYTAVPGSTPDAGVPVLVEVAADPSASSSSIHLSAFEGCTGAIEGRPGAWSLLGIVVARPHTDGAYQLDITFRGSQSGSAYRAAFLGMIRESGNPDWVTDMEMFKMTRDPLISAEGVVVVGLRDSVVSALGTLHRCLQDVEARHGGPPDRIVVAGHSLGGALAAQFAAGVTAGAIVPEWFGDLAHWPWSATTLVTFGSPKVGDDVFASHVDHVLDTDRVWVAGDPITRFPLNTHIGRPLELVGEASGTEAHEPGIIRRALLDHGDLHPADVPPEPWVGFATLGDALVDADRRGYLPADLVSDRFPERSALMAGLAAQVIGTRSSYRIPITKSPLLLRRRKRRVLDVFDGPMRSIDELESKMAALSGVQPDSDIEDHLRRMLVMRAAATYRWTLADLASRPAIAAALGMVTGRGAVPLHVSDADRRKINRLVWMRTHHHTTVNEGSVARFRRRVVPVSPMPLLRRACATFDGLAWLPPQLDVPATIPPEARLPTRYVAAYYGIGKAVWNAYTRYLLDPTVEWSPRLPWNHAFPPTGDGWEEPTSDATFVRLRMQGPNPFLLQRVPADAEDEPAAGVYEHDLTPFLDGVLPPIAARFVDRGDPALAPLDITIGGHRHRPGDATWDQAKRTVNAADARYATFGRHLLDVHLVVGQSFALSAYELPTWHRLRPFLHFFTYGTLTVNDMAYRALLTPSSYFLASGFVETGDVHHLFRNGLANFDLGRWNVPGDLARRGLGDLAGRHPYADDASLVWPAFEQVVDQHLDDLRLDDAAIAADADLQRWFDTISGLLPGPDLGPRLDRDRLHTLCMALLWNNVVHEICGDLSPLLGSEDPQDKAIVHLPAVRRSVGDGSLAEPMATPRMADVFLIDQASYVSRFNVGGNNLLAINAARLVDDPKLRAGIERFQRVLADLQVELEERNRDRAVTFARMLPSNWEASISF